MAIAAPASAPAPQAATQDPQSLTALWDAHGWTLVGSGLALLGFAWFVWRHRTPRRPLSRRTRFQRTVIDPAIARQHVAEWERAAPPVYPAQPPAYPAQPLAYPMQPPVAYGPYGMVAPHPPIAMPCSDDAAPYYPIAVTYHPMPLPAPYALPAVTGPCEASAALLLTPDMRSPPPSASASANDDAGITLPDACYHAGLELAAPLARGSEPAQLEQSRLQLLHAGPRPIEPAALRATRLGVAPMPSRPRHAWVAHVPDRRS